MAVDAMSFPAVNRVKAIAYHRVLSLGNRSKVFWINAGRVIAPMKDS